mmetsp:Transcript_39588/g.88056  ORF Transcript_39588/g.88056 Transcript_39588/m.88056 type:complete len:212 (-) Transcript_39588:422-1057(-)
MMMLRTNQAAIRTTKVAACQRTFVRRPISVRASADDKRPEIKLQSTALPLLAIPAAEGITAALTPAADYFRTLDLPEPLVHWGHPGNMMVVLLAMGGYGALYLGWQIRTSSDGAVVAKAKDMHPKLAAGMTFFFALGASGGMMSLLMQGKPIFESAHVWTGLGGLALLAVQATLPAFFAQGARDAHAYLGTALMGLFLVHAALGLQLGFSI